MIRQEINLYQERFQEKKLLFSALNCLLMLGIAAIFLVFSAFQYQSMLAAAEQRQQQLEAERDTADQRLKEVQVELQRLLADNSLDLEIEQVNREIRVRKRMIRFVDENRFGSGEGFSGQLFALAEIGQDDLWLNEIELSSGYVKLSGSALNEQSVPAYFNQFRQRALFAGRVFDVFELGRSEDRDWKIDFVIASRASRNE